MYFSLFLTERKKPRIYSCGKLPTPGLYIPEIGQEAFGPLDGDLRVRHFRHIVASVTVVWKEESSNLLDFTETLFMYLHKSRLPR